MIATTPTRRQRLSMAWSVLRGSKAVARRQGKFPLIWPQMRAGEAQWQIVDYQSYVDRGFNLNSLIYSAIMVKWRAKSAAPLRAYTGTRDRPELLDSGHPLSRLISRPNPHQSMGELEGNQVVFLNLAGNAYTVLVRPSRDELPVAMYAMRPDRVYIVPHPTKSKDILGYLYVPEGAGMMDGLPVLPQDMMHVKLPNPGDPLDGLGYGLSPLSPIAQSANVDNDITEFLKLFFDRGAMLPGLLNFDVPMDDEDIAMVKRRWMEIYGGFENWTDVGVLDQGGSYQRIGLGFDEMGFESIDERTESRILSPFGVPPIMIGSRMGLLHSTYSNYETARKAFWEDTFIPELFLFNGEYAYYLRTDDGAFVQYDVSRVPALQAVILEKVQGAYQMWQMGAPAEVAYETVGLSVGEFAGSSTGWLPLNLMPVGASAPRIEAPETEAEAPDATDDDRDEKFWQNRKLKAGWNDEQKQRLWKQIDAIAESWEGRFAAAVVEQMRRDQRELLALLTEAKSKALERKATIDYADIGMNWDAYYAQFSDPEWQKAFLPLVRGVVNDQGESWSVALGMQWDIEPLDAIGWFQDYMLTFAQPIIETTIKDLHALITQAMQEGWSIQQISKQLGLTFDRYLDPDFTLDGRGLTDDERQWFIDRSPRYRKDLIGRTETIRASNAGNTEIYKQFGLTRHEWLATPDARTRDTHVIANGQIRNVGEPFDVGGSQLRYPGDASLGAPIEEWAQCRCTTIPVIDF